MLTKLPHVFDEATRVTAGDWTLLGVTTDDDIIFNDDTNHITRAVPIAGGTPTMIEGSDAAFVRDGYVVSYSHTDTKTSQHRIGRQPQVVAALDQDGNGGHDAD